MFKFLYRLFFGSDKPANGARTLPQRKSEVKHLPPRRPIKTQDEPKHHPTSKTIKGKCFVIDGDTIVISGTHIRLAGIDAPELDQPYGNKSKFAMIELCKGQVITADIQEDMSYDRLVANCYLPNGANLSALLVEQGLALDWAKFSGGVYRHLEPEGARRKMWRVAAKHKGKFKTKER